MQGPDDAHREDDHVSGGGCLAPAPPLRPASGRGRRGFLLQVIGFAVGAAMFAWALTLALDAENRGRLAAVADAPIALLGLLAGLTAASIVVNGLIFWTAARPVHRLRILNTVAVNAIATFLSILPFKLNLITRVLIHHRRDGMAARDLIAWLAAVAALGLAVLGPLAAATLWRGELDALWWSIALGGTALLAGVAVGLGRAGASTPVLARASLGSWRIVRHPSVVVTCQMLRLADVALLAGRFLAVAAIMRAAAPESPIDLTIDRAVLLATAWFALSVAAPAGTIGYRELGAAGVGALAGMGDAIAPVAILLTATETIVSGAAALPSAALLRVHALVGRSERAHPPQGAP